MAAVGTVVCRAPASWRWPTRTVMITSRVHRLLYESLAPSGLLGLGSQESLRCTPYETCYEELDGHEKIYRRVK